MQQSSENLVSGHLRRCSRRQLIVRCRRTADLLCSVASEYVWWWKRHSLLLLLFPSSCASPINRQVESQPTSHPQFAPESVQQTRPNAKSTLYKFVIGVEIRQLTQSPMTHYLTHNANVGCMCLPSSKRRKERAEKSASNESNLKSMMCFFVDQTLVFSPRRS